MTAIFSYSSCAISAALFLVHPWGLLNTSVCFVLDLSKAIGSSCIDCPIVVQDFLGLHPRCYFAMSLAVTRSSSVPCVLLLSLARRLRIVSIFLCDASGLQCRLRHRSCATVRHAARCVGYRRLSLQRSSEPIRVETNQVESSEFVQLLRGSHHVHSISSSSVCFFHLHSDTRAAAKMQMTVIRRCQELASSLVAAVAAVVAVVEVVPAFTSVFAHDVSPFSFLFAFASCSFHSSSFVLREPSSHSRSMLRGIFLSPLQFA